MTGWIFILLSSAASVLIAHLLKLIEYKKLNTLRVLTVNYLVATGVAFIQPGEPLKTQSFELLYPVLGLAVVIGIIFIANFFVYSKSVDKNGVGISVAAMRVSLILPVLLSTLWYREYLLTRQWLGVILVFFTLYLLLPNKKNLLRTPFQAAWLLVLLFLFTGIGDASLKVYEADFSGLLTKQQFMGFVFLSAFLTGLFTILIRKNWQFSRQEIWLGILIGVPNLYTAIFLIEALALMSGGIVYTAANLFTVLGATALGIWRWGDILTRPQWLGILFTVFAIILMI